MIQLITDKRSNHFSSDLDEEIVIFSNPAQVSHNYRQLITNPLRIITDIYQNYIRFYKENPDIVRLFDKGANENDMHSCIRTYTLSGSFSTTINRHLTDNVLSYFESTLYYIIDYQLVKCLIDFVALCIYRQELQPYFFSDTLCLKQIFSNIFLALE